jgi:hypothetical protein
MNCSSGKSSKKIHDKSPIAKIREIVNRSAHNYSSLITLVCTREKRFLLNTVGVVQCSYCLLLLLLIHQTTVLCF